LINKLRVKGQIGVYGRSIGGIAATHLVKKFPDIIKVFVGDRTMGKFDKMVYNRYAHGENAKRIFKMLTCNWKVNNVEGFIENKGCYKINCVD